MRILKKLLHFSHLFIPFYLSGKNPYHCQHCLRLPVFGKKSPCDEQGCACIVSAERTVARLRPRALCRRFYE